MTQVQIYQRFDSHVDPEAIETRIENVDLSNLLSKPDKAIIEGEWDKVQAIDPGAFFVPEGLGSLYDTTGEIPVFRTTDFQTYGATTNTHKEKPLSAEIYDQMRVSAIGAAVALEDGSVIVTKRSKNATHVPNAWDSSVAGIAHIKGGMIDFQTWLHKKLQGELEIMPEDIEGVRATGLHSSRDPDFSGMYDFSVRTLINRRRIEEVANRRVREDKLADYVILSPNKLPDFILDIFGADKYACLDGCATLLLSLDEVDYSPTLKRLQDSGRGIGEGSLRDGVYFPSVGMVA